MSPLGAQEEPGALIEQLRLQHRQPSELADALASAASDASTADRRRDAIALYEAALEEESRLDRWLEPVRIRLGYASVLAEVAELQRAREELQAVQSLLEQAPAGIDSSTVTSLDNRLQSMWGTVAYYRGDAHLAIEHWQRAAGGYEAAGDRLRLARSRYQEAQARIALHDYAEAIVALRSVLEVEERPRFREQVSISLGICHYELNQFDEAAVEFERILASAAKRGDRVNQAWALGELGLVAWRQGDWQQAHARNRSARQLSESIGDPRNAIAWQVNDALVYASEGRPARAESLLRAARRRDAELGAPGVRRAVIERHLGRALMEQGRSAEARELFEKAFKLARSIGDRREEWKAAHQLGLAHARLGDDASARAAFEVALDRIDEVRGTLRLESFKRDFLRDKFTVYSAAIDLIATSEAFDDRVAATFEIAERVRARAFLDTLSESRAGLHETLPSEFAEREADLLEQRAEWIRRGSADQSAGTLAEIDDQLEANLLRAKAASSRFALMRPSNVAPLTSLQQSLHREEMLLAYFLGEEAAYLWMIDHQRAELVALGSSAELSKLASQAFSSLSRPNSALDLGELSRRVLEPFQAFAARRDPPEGSVDTVPLRLLILPSGPLHLVPFEALSLEGDLLGETAEITYVPSAGALVELRNRPIEVAYPPSMVAIGGVDYSEFEGDTARARELTPLPDSGREAQQVSRRFGRGAVVLRGTRATETRLLREVGGRSVVHIAAHSRVDASRLAESAVILGADGDNDGLIGLREIVRLPLRADLVTLSACETALGELVNGEGLVGLARAFFYAGTDTVVASLWNVDDRATAELMLYFYEELARGKSKAAALASAKSNLRNRLGFEHPYYWAAFVLIGRGEDAVAFPGRGRWPWIGWGTALFVAVGWTVARWRRRRGTAV